MRSADFFVSELVLVGVVEATPISTSIVLERALLAQLNYGDDQFTLRSAPRRCAR
jgi:hypothetical protein